MLGVVKQDIVYALRLMRANKALTAAIVLTLALGIGSTTAIFSVVNAVVLRPLPFEGGDRMVVLYETLNGQNGSASGGHFRDWSAEAQSYDAIAAWQSRSVNLTDGEPERFTAARVTPSFFRVFYAPPALGRYFGPDDTDASRVVVLSYPLWQGRFAGDPAIVGREITLNGEKHTVIGVAPSSSTMTRFDARLWTPLTFTPEQQSNYGAHTYLTLAKLKPGVTIAQAEAELERITQGIRARQPDQMDGRGVNVESYSEALTGDYSTQLWVLLGAVVFVLLIACGNVASLLLARATTRQKEIAIRGALGGGQRRLVRQLLTESLVLALIGGAAGLLVARAAIGFLTSAGPANVPRLASARLDLEVMLFALGITIACGVLFGIAPALRATRLDLQGVLREEGRSSRGVVRDRVRASLIVTEIAVALVLLVSAGLFVRSALQLQQVDPGFDPTGVTMARVALPADRYPSAELVEATYTRMVEEARRLPGVQSAGAGNRVPMWGGSSNFSVQVDGRPPNLDRDLGHLRMVTAGFFETLRYRIVRGRGIIESDLARGAPWVVVINETMARHLFGNDNPLGQRISGWTSGEGPEWREIVGVVADVRSFGLEGDVENEIYMPMTQEPAEAWDAIQRGMTIVVRADPGANIVAPLREAIRRIDPLLPLYDVQTMEEVLAQSSATRRFNTMLLSLLALTGLILAAIGVYGVIAFFVNQRTHEIGVRMALGATAASVVRMVVTHAVSLAVLGVLVGSVVAFWATRVLESMLYQTTPRDAIAYGLAAVVLIAVGAAAALLPARRAVRVPPLRSLGAP